MIARPRWGEGGGPDEAMLASCLREHLWGLPRLTRLRRCYDGRADILQRQREPGLPNNRLAHGYPRFITAMAAGYLLGAPVAYHGAEEGVAALREAYRRTDIDSVDAELARNASIYGRAVELVYADEQARARSVSLDPACAFVVYDDTVAAKPLFGVYYAPVRTAEGGQEGWWVHVLTETSAVTYRAESLAELRGSQRVACREHYFGGVPLVEYWNDECCRGDFEPVLGLIDAYDQLQSDRMNDKQQFVDALLLLTGCTLETDERGRSPGQQLREDKALALPDSDARAEWLCKQLNEADTEVLRQALKEDIHKLCLVPDLTDREFAGNSSGVAMRYKLLGLQQLIRVKERWFREGLRGRMRLYAAFLGRVQGVALDPVDVEIQFSRNLPENGPETAQMLNALSSFADRNALTERAKRLLGED